jgi:hypothetical protein
MKFDEYEGAKPAVLVKAALDRMFPVGSVFEVRIPKTRFGTISGYFNDTAIAASLIAKENGKHQAIYVTANPVNPDLLARNENRFEQGSQTTTTDAEITSRRWFLVDLDPTRPAGISSTAGELELARQKAEDIKAWLTEQGWPKCVTATSGNGYHLMYRVDEPNDEPTRIEFEYATKMLASIFTDEKIAVDTTVWNASRIWKIYGTIAGKGSNTEERPHRVSMVVDWPRDLEPVGRGLISTLALALRDSRAEEYKDQSGEFISDMHKWLSDRGLSVTSGPRPMFGNEGRKWTISRCPFNPQHSNPVIGLVQNRPVFRCLHNSCSAFRWKEFREKIDPNFKDPDVVYARLVEWCHSDAGDIDPELADTACRTGKKLAAILGRVKKDVPRPRFLVLDDLLKVEQRKFIKETMGENNEKGNLVGLINRTRRMQEEGIIPMFWVADYDFRIRVGDVGDIHAPKCSTTEEIALLVKFHSLGDSWVKQTHCFQIIQNLASERIINPLRVMLKALRWDGVKRLDDWLPKYLGTKDNEYTRAIGRKWLISAAARAINPGCQADHMLILEGKQGIGKSRALRILGGDFYTEYSGAMSGGGTGHKDMVAVIIGKSIVEMSELASIKKGDMESLKAMLTITRDDARLSYERDAKTYPRTCIFAGTTNQIGNPYIADPSGARRFWPTVAGEEGPTNCEGLQAVRDQLWAEAVEAYDNGEDWWSVPKELTDEEQSDRQISVEMSDPWFQKVRSALTDPDSYSSGCFHVREEYAKGMPTGGIIVRVGAMHTVLQITIGKDTGQQTAVDAIRMREIYRTLGFKKSRPAGGWLDSTYSYDLRREQAPHLWSAVEAAARASKTNVSLADTMAEDQKKKGG